VALDPARTRAQIDGVVVIDGGIVDQASLGDAAAALQGPEVVLRVDLGAGDGSATVFGCDLSEEYVRINARYRT
jgi:glutamate N-acetyltransferase/amino-acid N-acetyltransferase